MSILFSKLLYFIQKLECFIVDVVDRIDQLLDREGISAARMCRDLSFSSGLFSQWRRRSQRPSAEKLQKIAGYFGVTMDYLMTGKEETDAVRYALYQETTGVSEETLDRILQFARFARIEEKKRKEKAQRPEQE